MSTFLERFVLAVLATVGVAILLANPMEHTVWQRVGLGIGILGVAIFIGATVEKMRSPAPQAPVREKVALPIQLDFGSDPALRTDVPESMNHRIGEWYPVVGTRPVTLDWSSFDDAVAVAEIDAAGQGQIAVSEPQIGIIAEGPIIARGSARGKVRISIPRQSGKRTYTLMYRRHETTIGFLRTWSATLTVSSATTQAEPFRREKLGGSLSDYVPFIRNTVLWQAVPEARDVEIDWDAIGPAVVKALINISVECPRGECGGFGTVRIRDLTDGTFDPTDERVASPTHGGMGWVMRGSPDVRPAGGSAKIYLRQKTGRHRYRLEVGADKTGFGVAAAGEMQFYR